MRMPSSTTWSRSTGRQIQPIVTWGINPGQSVGVGERIPDPESAPEQERATYREALAFMGFEAGQPIAGTKIDVAFVGSCTNGRLSDLRVAAAGRQGPQGGQPGYGRSWCRARSRWRRRPRRRACTRSSGEAGFEWRKAGCSMCLGMNDDKLKGREVCASSSNRNFIGRQGSPTGRTLLMSPAMVAAAAVAGAVTDVREMMR